MKKINLIILNLFILTVFLLTGCDKDGFSHAGLGDISTVKLDSLQCKVWLQNTKGDTTNLFKKGKNIKVGVSLLNLKKNMIHIALNELYSDDLSIYRAKDNHFVGHPYTYMREAIFVIAPVPSQKTMEDTFTIVEGKTTDEQILPEGEYYLKIAYQPSLYYVDTARIEKLKFIEKLIFPDMKIRFKIREP